MLESAEIILQAWTQEKFSYQGQFFNLDNVSVVPKPVQQPHPPLFAAANSLETFSRMGSLGYSICVASQVNPFFKIKEFLPHYHDARSAAGHPTCTEDDITLLMPLYVADSQQQVQQEVEPSVTRFLQAIASIYTAQSANFGTQSDRMKAVLSRVQSMTYEKMSDIMAVFATPDACVERIAQFQTDFGMGRTICWFNPGGMVPHIQVMRSMELFAAKVMPQFT